MAHVALYREWRPLTFDEVVEQQHAVIALRQAVLTGQIAHAYLFSGTRGTGKTTLAKIFSRAINCLDPQNGNPCNRCSICTGVLNGSLLDVVEMDAASNNSVDTIRRICDEVVFMPSQARFKVYIIDEVHMLSTGAFNALLKTLEEPPAHAVFILATTEPHRIPATILSRCQRYEFRRIPLASLVGRLNEIAEKDGIAIDESAVDMIARLAEGGMRDAISLLDQVRMTAAPGHVITRDDVLMMTGVADDELLEGITQAMLQSDAVGIIRAVEQLIMAGRDPARFLIDLAAFCRNLLVILVTPDPLALLQITHDQHRRLSAMVQSADSTQLIALIRSLSALHGELRWSTDTRTTLEIGLLRIMSELAPTAVPAAQVSRPLMPVRPVVVQKQPSDPRSATLTTSATKADSNPVPVSQTDSVSNPKFEQASMPQMESETKSQSDLGLVPPPEQELAPPPDWENPTPADQPPYQTSATAPVQKSTESPSLAPVQAPTESLSQTFQNSISPFVSSNTTMASETEDNDKWQAIQNQLLLDGQMTLYLFSRPAAASFCGGELHLIFSSKDRVNCQEMSEPQNLKHLRSAASQIIGTDTPVIVRLADDPQAEAQHCPVPDEPAWISRVRHVAGELNIPIKMED